MRTVCGCCCKPICDDDSCPGCRRWQREEHGTPAVVAIAAALHPTTEEI